MAASELKSDHSSAAEVEVVRADDLRAGDTIWAPDDGDWLEIDRLEVHGWETVVYRTDGSETAFDEGRNVLRVVA